MSLALTGHDDIRSETVYLLLPFNLINSTAVFALKLFFIWY